MVHVLDAGKSKRVAHFVLAMQALHFFFIDFIAFIAFIDDLLFMAVEPLDFAARRSLPYSRLISRLILWSEADFPGCFFNTFLDAVAHIPMAANLRKTGSRLDL